ncbi:type II toxin-antitoxin system prevent-host-death family antitoxin [Mesorhizobium sp. M1428]|uniref:type II toxin-antitoxin system prevent-host-death family antitoxin n=1 Tax=Mesorhizobium sp. M1428 TaxID=2957102 RepID=UPI00333B8110
MTSSPGQHDQSNMRLRAAPTRELSLDRSIYFRERGLVMRVTSTEFQQNVGRFQDAAQRTPVAITKNGRTHTVLLSAARSRNWTTRR